METEKNEVDVLMDAMEQAWGIIANGRAWDEAFADDWESAKFRWRDECWHPSLDRYIKSKVNYGV